MPKPSRLLSLELTAFWGDQVLSSRRIFAGEAAVLGPADEASADGPVARVDADGSAWVVVPAGTHARLRAGDDGIVRLVVGPREVRLSEGERLELHLVRAQPAKREPGLRLVRPAAASQAPAPVEQRLVVEAVVAESFARPKLRVGPVGAYALVAVLLHLVVLLVTAQASSSAPTAEVDPRPALRVYMQQAEQRSAEGGGAFEDDAVVGPRAAAPAQATVTARPGLLREAGAPLLLAGLSMAGVGLAARRWPRRSGGDDDPTATSTRARFDRAVRRVLARLRARA